MYKPNATLIIKTSGNTPIGIDPVTKHPIFTTTTQEVPARFKPTQSAQEIQSPGSADRTIKGQLRIAPADATKVVSRRVFELRLITNTKDGPISGRFYVEPTPASNLGLEAFFGVKLDGELRLG